MTRHPWLNLAAALLFSVLLSGAAGARIYINKIRYDKQANVDRIELANSAFAIVDVGGWTIRGNRGEYEIPALTVMGPLGRISIETPPIFHEVGDTIELIDATLVLALQDRVRFGTAGGAPAPPIETNAATVRTPDGVTGPPALSPNDELYWTVDLDPIYGAMNDAPAPALGSSLLINEIRIGGGALPDTVELLNPTPVAVNLAGWFITSANDVVFLGGNVPPFGFLVHPLPTTRLAVTERIDLFNADSVRVAQKGYHGMPASDCYGDCPDGAAPSNGYDFPTCGGWATWFPVICTLGGPNQTQPGMGCSTAGTPEPPIRIVHWGKLKTLLRTAE